MSIGTFSKYIYVYIMYKMYFVFKGAFQIIFFLQLG